MFDLTKEQMIKAQEMYDKYIPLLTGDLKKRFEEATKHDCNTMATPEGIYGLFLNIQNMGIMSSAVLKFYEVAVTTALDVEDKENQMFMSHVDNAIGKAGLYRDSAKAPYKITKMEDCDVCDGSGKMVADDIDGIEVMFNCEHCKGEEDEEK